jgi:O-antigen/teichoic acid export membrane protein
LLAIIKKLSGLKKHQGIVKYFKNTSWLLCEKLLRMILGFFITIWVARYLGPEEYGLFSYVISFVGLFSVVSTLGLDAIVMRELVKYEEKRDKLLGSAFFLKFIGAITVFILLSLSTIFVSHEIRVTQLTFIVATSLLFQSLNVIDFYFQSKVLAKKIVFSNTISLFISSIVKVILIINEAPLEAFAVVIVADSAITICGLVYFYLNSDLKIIKWNIDKSIMISLLKDSWPLMLASASFVIFSNIDNLMIESMLNTHAVGVYNASYKLVTLWYFLPGLILGSLMPAMVSASTKSDVLYKRMQYVASMLIYISLVIPIIYITFSEQLISITYGAEFKESSSILVVLVWVNCLIFYNSCWNRWMIIQNKTKRLLSFHLYTAVFNIIFNLVLIPKYGSVGAAYALLLSLFLTYLIHFILYKEMLSLLISAITFGKVRLFNK